MSKPKLQVLELTDKDFISSPHKNALIINYNMLEEEIK